jgi:Fe-S-cluster containining protein
LADYDRQEVAMMAKWYGRDDLVESEEFWQDCLSAFRDKTVPLPVRDEPAERARIHGLVNCPPGTCGACCQVERIPITQDELRALKSVCRTEVRSERDTDGKIFLATRGGCQFLESKTCAIYGSRPQACRAFPIASPTDNAAKESANPRQLLMKLVCPAALAAVRSVLKQACAGGKVLLLPDLSLIPSYQENRRLYAQAGLGV